MLGNGTGASGGRPARLMAVPGAPSSLQVADPNSDGRSMSLPCEQRDADSVTVLLGNGARWQVPPGRRLSASRFLADGACCRRPERRRARFCWLPARMASGCLDAVHTCHSRGRTLNWRGPRSCSTRGLITKLAADGNRVAVKATAQSSRSCGQIIARTAPGRRTKSFSTSNLGWPRSYVREDGKRSMSWRSATDRPPDPLDRAATT